MPTRARSKMPSPDAPVSRIHRPLTTRLVLVPIRVQVPPAMLAKLRGIISRDTGSRWRLAQSATAGMNIATTGVLLRKALITATGVIRRSWAARRPVGRPSTEWAIQPMPPVSRRPATTT